MRLGLPLFDIDEACLRCPQNSDHYDHHCLAYIMIGKTGLYNYIRDEVCRLLSRGGLRLKIESLGFLPDEPDRRPADLLTIPSAFRITRGRKIAEDYAIIKRLDQATYARYRE